MGAWNPFNFSSENIELIEVTLQRGDVHVMVKDIGLENLIKIAVQHIYGLLLVQVLLVCSVERQKQQKKEPTAPWIPTCGLWSPSIVLTYRQ